MANNLQAKKRIRQIAKRTERNKDRVSRIRTYLRGVERAIASGDKSAAETAYKAAMPELHRGVSKGVMHRNTVARKLSRLSSRIKSL